MRFTFALAAALLFSSLTAAAPPDVPAEIKATPGQLVRVTVKTDKKIGTAKNFKDEDAFFGELLAPAGQRQYVFQPPVSGGKSVYVLTFWTEGELEGATCTITVSGVTPPTPPDPKPPMPPDPKPPGPVTSFRVILVYESGATLTATQTGVLYGLPFENAIKSATTGDATKFGWRRLDKDADPSTLPTGLREVWAAAKPQLTGVPCVVFQVNDKITIESLPATNAAGVELVTKYRGK